MSRQFHKDAFHKFILDNQVIGFFEREITLKSGRSSLWYANWRTVGNDAFLLDQLTDFVIAYLSDQRIEADSFFGVPESATKLAIVTAFKAATRSSQIAKGSHTIAMGRSSPKKHGDPQDRYFIGSPRGKTLVIEDTVTTGGSLITTVDQLLKLEIEVSGVLCLLDRMQKNVQGQSITEVIKSNFPGNMAFHAMSSAAEVLPLAFSFYKIKPSIISAIKAEFEKFGTLKLS